MAEEKSEFGKGLVICLLKFATHFSNSHARDISRIQQYLEKSEEERKLILSEHPPDNLNYGEEYHQKVRYWVEKTNDYHQGDITASISQDLEMWANGASDHLYEIEVPDGEDWSEIRSKVEELQNLGLKMGHGFIQDNLWVLGDYFKLRDLTIEIALLIDKKLGLKPEEGTWQ